MKAQTRKLVDTTTAEVVIAMGNYEIRQYWTKGGVYGPQVLTCIFGDYPNFFEHKTSGCGYCKLSAGLEAALQHVWLKPRGMQLGCERINRKYHVGGNFYKVPKKDIVKIK